MYFDFLLTVFSGTSSSTFSSVFGGMYSDICSDIFGHSIWHLLFVFYLAVVSGMYSDICLAYILAFDLAFTLTSSLAFYLAPTLVLLWHLYLAPISGTYCDSLSVIVSGFLTFYDMNPSGRCFRHSFLHVFGSVCSQPDLVLAILFEPCAGAPLYGFGSTWWMWRVALWISEWPWNLPRHDNLVGGVKHGLIFLLSLGELHLIFFGWVETRWQYGMAWSSDKKQM